MHHGLGPAHYAARHGKQDQQSRFARTIDRLVYAAGIAVPFLIIPQALKIWHSHNASGVSLITWSVFFLAALLWLLYGIVHREKPIIIANFLLMLFDAVVLVGILLY